ncbi:hypothetical protein FDP41_009265 [Naegleria fowleri]|uniref:Uncharacterized protein n=1 Tax=Naegleria fowleri TaxID=5763 RepID=A0A6A5BBN6_NAEFO|nr:uncharacterized protein FDP41_009265 [Naegleria fowleri]KAF0972362.1 hypothetical protein FDP41_009265 [Naegleria fowleri]CAG4717855.1 unnamed protein product [Naegleria fowleri]
MSTNSPKVQLSHTTTTTTTRLLTRSQVQSCLSFEGAMKANRTLFQSSDLNAHLIPIRTVLDIPQNGPTLFMPCFLNQKDHDDRTDHDDNTHLGIKIVSVRKDNPIKFSRDSITGSILLLNECNGALQCVMHAGDITAVRTACGSALCVERILNVHHQHAISSCIFQHEDQKKKKEFKVLGIFGCGLQGKAHVMAVLRVALEVNKVILWNPSLERAQKLKHYLLEEFVSSQDLPFSFVAESCDHHHNSQKHSSSLRNIEIEIITNANEAVQRCDIICCCTNASKPFFSSENVKEGSIITCIGSYKPHMQEIDSDLIRKGKVIADLVKAVMEEAGDLIVPLKEGKISHDHVVCGLSDFLKFSNEDITKTFNIGKDIIIYKSVGFAGQDICVAKDIYERAVILNIGTCVDMEQ